MKLVEKMNGEWVFESAGARIVGDFFNVVFIMCSEFNFSPDEIELGIEDMCKNNHNAIFFGDINKTYMFTSNVDA